MNERTEERSWRNLDRIGQSTLGFQLSLLADLLIQ